MTLCRCSLRDFPRYSFQTIGPSDDCLQGRVNTVLNWKGQRRLPRYARFRLNPWETHNVGQTARRSSSASEIWPFQLAALANFQNVGVPESQNSKIIPVHTWAFPT